MALVLLPYEVWVESSICVGGMVVGVGTLLFTVVTEVIIVEDSVLDIFEVDNSTGVSVPDGLLHVELEVIVGESLWQLLETVIL